MVGGKILARILPPAAGLQKPDFIEDRFQTGVVFFFGGGCGGLRLEGVEPDAERLFLGALTIVPRAALQAHDQHIVADEMRLAAGLQEPEIGGIGAHRLDFLGRGYTGAGKGCL